MSENPPVIYMIKLQCQKGGRAFERATMYYVVCFCAVLCFQTFARYRYKTDIKGRFVFCVRFAIKLHSKCTFRDSTCAACSNSTAPNPSHPPLPLRVENSNMSGPVPAAGRAELIAGGRRMGGSPRAGSSREVNHGGDGKPACE